MPIDVNELSTMVQSRRYAELEERVRDALLQEPGSGLLWKALGVSLLMQGKDALEALQSAARHLPDDAEAHGNLAHEWQRRGRFADALDHYSRVLELRPDFAQAHGNLGNALRGLGRLEEAVASYRRALAIDPNYAEACINAGNATLQLGRVAEAASFYARALVIKPDIAEVHNNLANALRRLGRPQDAVAHCAEALRLNPRFAGAHGNLSDALRDIGDAAGAADSARRALAIEPGQAAAHNSLGNALLDLGRLEDALRSYREALRLEPALRAARINEGLALRQLGRSAEAEAACRSLLDTDPRCAAATVLLAELRSDAGDFQAAEALYRRASEADPQMPEAWAGRAHLRKLTLDDAPWAAQVQRIADSGPASRQESPLRYALGKYFDDVGEFDRAFGQFHRANELAKRQGALFDRGQMTRTVDRLMSTFDGSWATRPPAGDCESARAVFIVGMPRSGTTLAEQILASHPAIVGAGELPFWSAAAAAFEFPPSGHAGLATSVGQSAWSAAMVDRAAGLGTDYVKLLRDLCPDALRVIDKMPGNFLSLGLIHTALPNARIIHMRRHPIDTCLSVYFQHFKTAHAYGNDLDDLAHYYREYSRLMRHWKAVLPAGSMLDMPYEALVEDQATWTRTMLDFIGVPWDPRCLDFHRTDRRVMTASKWQVRQRISKSSVQRWKNYRKFLGPLQGLVDF